MQLFSKMMADFAIAGERLWTMIGPEIRSIGWQFRLSANLSARTKELGRGLCFAA
jgi:hypothetical protein